MQSLFILFLVIIDLGCASGIVNRTIPEPLQNGTIITLLVNHTEDAQAIAINFYETFEVTNSTLDSKNRFQVKIRRNSDNEAIITTRGSIDGQWYDEKESNLVIDGISQARGVWRIDLYKLNSFCFAVFLQGFFANISDYRVPINNMKSLYIFEEGGNIDNITIDIKKTNDYIQHLRFRNFSDIIDKWPEAMGSFVFDKLHAFPVGSHIDMTSFLRASGNSKDLVPTIGFRNQDGDKSMALAIVQKWEDNASILRLVRIDSAGSWADQVLCSPVKTMGDLQHIRIERTGTKSVTMTIFFTNAEGKSEWTCTLKLTDTSGLDKEFEIVGINGGRPLHLDHSVPRQLKKENIATEPK